MELGLKGKVVVIMGGATGIGKACALAFAAEGCKVAICGRSKNKLDAAKEEAITTKGYELLTMVADATVENQVEDFAAWVYKQYGKIDIWINNAGVSPKSRLIDMSGDEWDDLMRNNLKSVFIGSKIAARYMKDSGGGVILNASSFASIMPLVTAGAYATSKAAVSSLTKSLAAELAPYRIRVNAYIPGLIRTDINKDRVKLNEAKYVSQIALNRLGVPEDVAPALVFLASELAGYITGTEIEITGGKFIVQDPDTPWSW